MATGAGMALRSGKDLASVLEAVEGVHALVDIETFPQRAIAIVRQLIPSDAGVFLVINCCDQRIRSCAHEPADLGFPDMEDVFERHLHEHPLLTRYLRSRDG